MPSTRVLLLLLLLTACSSPGLTPTESATVTSSAPAVQPSATPRPPAPGQPVEQVRNAEYQLGAAGQVRNILLSDGVYEEGAGTDTSISIRMTDFIVFGDLDGDEQDEAAVLVRETYGGSEPFVFLAVYELGDRTPVFLTSIFIDDRPRVDRFAIEDAEVLVDVTVHTPEDAVCCPGFPTARSYRLVANNLFLARYSTRTPAGQLRLITIDSPPSGGEVDVVVQVTGTITIAPFENNLVYRIYDSGGVEVVAGPITVSAPDLGAPGSFDQTLNLNAFKGTIVRLAIQDVNAADGSLFAMDSVILRVR